MATGQKPIRILTVDDHALLRNGIRRLIGAESDMQLVAEASTGREAVEEFRTHRPDVTLMDLQMPDMNGIEAIIAIRGEFPEARIVVLSTYSRRRPGGPRPESRRACLSAQGKRQ